MVYIYVVCKFDFFFQIILLSFLMCLIWIEIFTIKWLNVYNFCCVKRTMYACFISRSVVMSLQSYMYMYNVPCKQNWCIWHPTLLHLGHGKFASRFRYIQHIGIAVVYLLSVMKIYTYDYVQVLLWQKKVWIDKSHKTLHN